MLNNVSEFLDASVKKYPNKIAFIDENDTISYAKLQVGAKKFASYLLNLSIKPNSAVVFFMPKSLDAVQGIFGCLYARVCYSFFEVNLPAKRLIDMLSVLKAPPIITTKEHYTKAYEIFNQNYKNHNVKIILIDECLKAPLNNNGLTEISHTYQATDALSIVFTSGSTGIPKGVVKSHANILYFTPTFVSTLKLNSDEILANQAPFDFDVAAKDIYCGVYVGASVLLLNQKDFTKPTTLIDKLIKFNVTTLIWAVSALCLLSAFRVFNYKIPNQISKVFFSGEIMPLNHLKTLQHYLPNAKFVNLYGPSEITYNCTFYEVPKEYGCITTLPIGKAFKGQKVFLLSDDTKQINEVGKIGEICVSGPNVALGYWCENAKSNEVFIQNPLNKSYFERIYKTGDLGVLNDNGELVYVGRKDFMVKHMGHRIELSEIELAAQKLAERACAIFKNYKINLFFTGVCDESVLMGELKKNLPTYMLPNKLIRLEKFTLNTHGKIDRKILEDML
ncbi:AMP-binding protein [Campylobacter hyointestinalis]|uniref:D-alanine--poly(Phosphoribitol) ligase n=1 Tax=Campylobacter hyointestinalis subsp. hyointestinalis TaxID=91352 RepID=A0A855N2L9_CAMHY|nr:AMP-binding protein [Campylobacter hyointestinalis]KEA43980.1 hypothetical protein CR67_07485 [Campylobacter hyointestinalis subsp. hyointestinalis]PPB58684.1 D-alanine--poly(phosphoribitol) ligase [Campylobacter hyointestinalis subsp. hyointestinalis]PPB63173.1 D-alanine--poly(phosphoribitol) ligase [Campylobacter hyointestinalis subsp. hyointestinalis]PPB71529.1 D-alanine--poly(phosphoribitol) ligase [Campylobacter hyointestinalis subsp. hyointestinalis]QKF56149.1 AMP-forming adenylation 